MKKYFTLIILTVSGIIFYGFAQKSNENPQEAKQAAGFQIPEKVQSIFDKSCVDCHSTASSNTKAKLKLKIDELSTLSSFKQAGKLSDIAKEIQEGKMPPSKYLEKNPDKKLSEEEVMTVVNWAKETSAKLAGQ